MSSETIITCRNVGKAFQLYVRREDRLRQALFGFMGRYYKEHWVLHDVSFDVKRGECLGIVGRNGAGKTTLLQILCGITKPTHGTVGVKGRVAPILALGSGFDPELSGRENVSIGAAILGLKRRQIDAQMQSIRDFADIGEYFDQPIKLYSSGMVARLAFAVCAHVDADVLIIDEALSVGDQAFQAKCEAFIADFAKRGTLLIVSHALTYLEKVCNRVLWIEGGYVRECGAPLVVLADYARESTGAPIAQSEDEAPKARRKATASGVLAGLAESADL
jgi:lipopolysaccharide transport system ATP-binding protein